jgi:hypothetical protein
MHWSRVALGGSKIPLLTSDRPLDMHGLAAKDAYIVLPSTLRRCSLQGTVTHGLKGFPLPIRLKSLSALTSRSSVKQGSSYGALMTNKLGLCETE